MKFPPVPHPERYIGLYVYDFRTHVSVGYTAAEVRILRNSPEHADGTAYEIYRVNEREAFELRGTLDERLINWEALAFLRRDEAAARRDYDALLAAARRHPVPAAVDIIRANVDEFDPPHVTALTYRAAATTAISGWLSTIEFEGGDRVVGGLDVYTQLIGAGGPRLDADRLPAAIDYCDRPATEVLATVDRPLQR